MGWNESITWAGAAIASLAAMSSALSARRANRYTEAQEKRRQQRITIYFSEGYRKVESNAFRYGVCISLTNPSDSPNSVPQIEMEVSYTKPNFPPMAVKLAHNRGSQGQNGEPSELTLPIPLRLESGDTKAGWVYFEVRKDLLADGIVHDHHLVVTDSQGNKFRHQIPPLRDLEA